MSAEARFTVTNPEGTCTWPEAPEGEDAETLGRLAVGERWQDAWGYVWTRVA